MRQQVSERRNRLYLAFIAAAIPNDPVAAVLLPLTTIAVALATRLDAWHRAIGGLLLTMALVPVATGGSRAADAAHDPLFWAVLAAIALGLSGVARRWPAAVAAASALAGACAIVAVVMPMFPGFESRFPTLSLDIARGSLRAFAERVGVVGAACLLGLWLQAIAVNGPRGLHAGRTSAAVRGALLAALVLVVAGGASDGGHPILQVAALGSLLGLAEARGRRPGSAPAWTPFTRGLNPASWSPLALLLILELLFSILLLRAPGTGDVPSFWIAWSGTMVDHGLVEGYRLNNTDYPPLSMIMFLSIAKAALAASSTIFLGLKVTLVVLLLVSTYCFWRWWTSDLVMTSLLAFSLYLSGVALGYVDLFYAPSLILALWALRERRLTLFSVFFAITCLIKWQPLIIAPFFVLHAMTVASQREPAGSSLAKRWAALVVPAGALLLLMLAIFGTAPVLRSIGRALQHTYLSGTALNFNWLVTYGLERFRPELYGGLQNGMVELVHVDLQLPWVRVIRLAFVLLYLAALWRLFRHRGSFATAMECAVAGYLSYFIVNIGVHENHLFIGALLATATPALLPGTTTRAFLVNAMSNLNLLTFYGITGEPLGFSPIVGIDVSVIFAAVNVLLFVVFWTDIVSPRTLFTGLRPGARAGGSPPVPAVSPARDTAR